MVAIGPEQLSDARIAGMTYVARQEAVVTNRVSLDGQFATGGELSSITIVVIPLVEVPHDPPSMTARKEVVTAREDQLYVFVVFGMATHGFPSVLLSHCRTGPE